MSTLVEGPLRRSVSPDTFEDITGPGVLASIVPDGLSFDADLTCEQCDQIRARMTSRDDDDYDRRAALVAYRDANTAALADEMLVGDPPAPAPTVTEPERSLRLQINALIDAFLGD